MKVLLVTADAAQAAALGARFHKRFPDALSFRHAKSVPAALSEMRAALPDIVIGAHDWVGELSVNGVIAPVDLGGRDPAPAEQEPTADDAAAPPLWRRPAALAGAGAGLVLLLALTRRRRPHR